MVPVSDVNDNKPSISPEDLRMELHVDASCCTSYVKLKQLRVFDDDRLREREGGILERVPLAPSDFRIAMSDQCNGSRFLSVQDDGSVFWQPGASDALQREAGLLWERLVDAGDPLVLLSHSELSFDLNLTLCLLVGDKHTSSSSTSGSGGVSGIELNDRKENIYVTLKLAPEFLRQPSAEAQACMREPDRCLRVVEAPANYTVVSINPEYVLQDTYSESVAGRQLCLIRPVRHLLGQLRLVNRSTEQAVETALLRLDDRTLLDAKLDFEASVEIYTSAGVPDAEFTGKKPLQRLRLVENSSDGQLTLLWPPAEGLLYSSNRAAEPCERGRTGAGSGSRRTRRSTAYDEPWDQPHFIDWLNERQRLELHISMSVSYATEIKRRTRSGALVTRPGSRMRLELSRRVVVRVHHLNSDEMSNNLFVVRFSGASASASISWEEYVRSNMVDQFRNWMRSKRPHPPLRDEEPLLVGIRQFSLSRVSRSLHLLYYLFSDEHFEQKKACLAERLAAAPMLWNQWRDFTFAGGNEYAKSLDACPLDQCVKASTTCCVDGVRFNLTARDTYIRVAGGSSADPSSQLSKARQYLVPRFYENRYCVCKSTKLAGKTVEEFGGEFDARRSAQYSCT